MTNIDNWSSNKRKIIAVVLILVGFIAGFIGGGAYAAKKVDELVLQASTAAWASVEGEVASRVSVIRTNAKTEAQELRKSLNACADHEGSIILDKLQQFKLNSKK